MMTAALLFLAVSAVASAPVSAPARTALGSLPSGSAAYDALCAEYGIYSVVELRSPAGGGERGLFAARALHAGEPVVAVPWRLCLVDQDRQGDAALDSPFEVTHSPARDVRLAGALLAAATGDAAANIWGVALQGTPEERADRFSFWRRWAPLLPRYDQLCLPLVLPPDLLSELHDQRLVSAAQLQRRRLASLVGAVTHATADTAGGGGPTNTGGGGALPAAAWEWAVGLSMSRPFRMRVPALMHGETQRGSGDEPVLGAEASISGEDSLGDEASISGAAGMGHPGAQLTAFVPFIDMANHRSDPSCEVQGRVATGGGGYAAVALVAKRDIPEGEELTLSYFGAAPNAHTFCSFGFIPSGVNRHDRLGLTLNALPLSAGAVKATVRQLRQGWPGGWPPVVGAQGGKARERESGAGGGGGALLEAALLSLPLSRERSIPPGGVDPSAETSREASLQASVEAQRESFVQGSADASEEASRAEFLLEWLDAEASRDFVTSVEQDEAWLRRHRAGVWAAGAGVWAVDPAFGSAGFAVGGGVAASNQAGEGGVAGHLGAGGRQGSGVASGAMDARLPDLIEYRLQRKRLWAVARQVLAAHAARHRGVEEGGTGQGRG